MISPGYKWNRSGKQGSRKAIMVPVTSRLNREQSVVALDRMMMEGRCNQKQEVGVLGRDGIGSKCMKM